MLWPYGLEDAEGFDEGNEESGKVIAVLEEPCPEYEDGMPTGMVPERCGTVLVEVTSGPDAGTEIITDIPFGPGSPVDVESGDRVVLMHLPEGQIENPYHIIDYERGQALWALLIAFVVAIIAFGRWKGARALVSLALTFALVLLFIVPGILDGKPPLLVAIVGASAIMLASLYITHGWNRSTTMAVLGTLGSLLITGVLAGAAVNLAQINGIIDSETSLLSMHYGIDMSGLLLAGILIGALGVIDDVTISQSATVDELTKANPRYSRLQLYTAGMRVGRAHITSVVNTLVLAYAGAALPLLVLIAAAAQPLDQVVTSQLIATEIARAVIGTLGLIAAVPLTTGLAAWFAKQDPPKPKSDADVLKPPTKRPAATRKKRDIHDVAWGDEEPPHPKTD
ncbi:YibE/F family protein [Natronoglycomyces albus]|uniref:YibE/F family protein n=2 Tax=Natronoglycomyces albus TaxID=2811108 RepID=A0A895XXX7_9ACTN|nr:YibE/F family protein [Natronoglycomyces albus]